MLRSSLGSAPSNSGVGGVGPRTGGCTERVVSTSARASGVSEPLELLSLKGFKLEVVSQAASQIRLAAVMATTRPTLKLIARSAPDEARRRCLRFNSPHLGTDLNPLRKRQFQ